VNSRLGRTQEEDIEAAIASARTARNKQGAGVFLIVTSEGDVGEPDFEGHDDHRDFIVCENAFSGAYFQDRLETVVNGVLAALSLSLPPNRSRGITYIGGATYAIDPSSQKPIYSINLEISSTVSMAGPLDYSMLDNIKRDARYFVDDKRLASIGRLLVHSQQKKPDDLVWAALEMFVNGLFSDHYNEEWLSKLATGTPASAQRYFEHLRSVMKDKYSLADKFLIISSLLDEMSAEADTDKFRVINKVRNKIHTGEITDIHLSVEDVQRLIRKYIRLHVDHCRIC